MYQIRIAHGGSSKGSTLHLRACSSLLRSTYTQLGFLQYMRK
jgi:hypothetical protein